MSTAPARSYAGRTDGSRRPRLCRCVCLWLGLGLALIPVTASAQAPLAEQWFRRGAVMITAQAGGAAFTDFQRGMARSSSADLQPTEFQRRIAPRTTGSFGGWAAYWLSDTWGVRAGASYAPSSFTVRNEPTAQRALDGRTAERDEAAADYAGLGVLHADAAVMFRFPLTLGRLAPYGLAGGGLARYWRTGTGELPPEARQRFAEGAWNGVAGVVGVGGAIALQKRDLMLVFELNDHISSSPLNGGGAGEWFEVSGMRLQLEPDAGRAGTDGIDLTHNVSLLVGLTIVIPKRAAHHENRQIDSRTAEPARPSADQ